MTRSAIAIHTADRLAPLLGPAIDPVSRIGDSDRADCVRIAIQVFTDDLAAELFDRLTAREEPSVREEPEMLENLQYDIDRCEEEIVDAMSRDAFAHADRLRAKRDRMLAQLGALTKTAAATLSV